MGEITDRENEWLDRATAAAIAAARRVVTGDQVIPMNTPIGRLSDVEWGWIVSSMIFAWIGARAEQATVEGLDVEEAIRAGVSPDPWDAGAVAAILPKLADAVAIDWSKALSDWSRETMVQFLITALGLIRKALAARDRNNAGVTRGSTIGAGDLDHCRDSDGTIASWAQDLSNEAADAYREVTVFGSGLRIIGTANGNETHRKFTFDRKTGAGIELYRNTARYITVSGIEVSNCAALPSLDSFIDTVMARHGAGINTNGLDFNNAGQQQQPDGIDYEELIRNGAPEGGRSELFQAVVWHLAAKGLSADQIAEELAQYPNGIGAKYAARLLAEVERSFAKWHVEASRKQQERNRELATDPDHPTVPGGDADLRSSLHEVRWPSKGVRAH